MGLNIKKNKNDNFIICCVKKLSLLANLYIYYKIRSKIYLIYSVNLLKLNIWIYKLKNPEVLKVYCTLKQ